MSFPVLKKTGILLTLQPKVEVRFQDSSRRLGVAQTKQVA